MKKYYIILQWVDDLIVSREKEKN